MTERKGEKEYIRAGWVSYDSAHFFSAGQVTKNRTMRVGETEEDRENERKQIYLCTLPQQEPKTVIADKHVQKAVGCLHPTSCAFSQLFIPETENKWQELESPNVLRGSSDLLLSPRAQTRRPLQYPRALPFFHCGFRQDPRYLSEPATLQYNQNL